MENQAAPTNSASHNAAAAVDYGNYDYQPPTKRGRGYAPMGEFDLSLIREFRARPGFYDRNSESFKDKLHTAHQWQEISNKLGFDVSLLKDRMLQLRNRYNLEKRRLEQLRDENPGQQVESPWPLFEQLHFLSEHIRPRRSYKSMQPRTSLADDDDDEQFEQQQQQRSEQLQLRRQRQHLAAGGRDSLSDGGGGGGGNNISADMTPYANGLLSVKMEEPDAEDAADAESGSQSGTEDTNSAHPLKLSAASTLLSMQSRQPHSMSPCNNKSIASSSSKRPSRYSALPAAQPTSIKIRRLDTMQERAPSGGIVHLQTRSSNIPPRHSSFTNASHNKNDSNKFIERQRQQEYSVTQRPNFNMQVNRRCLSNSEQKYAAFGEFVSASLLELPAIRALQLVEKFTSEVVRVLVESKEKSTQEDAAHDPLEQQPQPQLPQQVSSRFTQINGGTVTEAVNGV